MPIQEEDWSQDINLEGQFFQKNGIFNLEPDKDLMLACERYMDSNPYHAYSDDDDTNSSVFSFATGSFISSRYSTANLVDSDLPNIDEYILNISSQPPDHQQPTSVTNFPGTIKRLGAHHKQAQRNDDWDDDIEIPTTGITPKHPQDLPSSSMLDEFDDDDVGPSISQRGSVHASPSNSSAFYYCEREEDDDDNMKGLDIPDNLLSFHQKLTEKKNADVTAKSSKIPVIIKSSPILSTIQREKDDDDFLDGLDVKDHKLFKQPQAAKPVQQQQQRITATPKKPSSPFISRLARPVKEPPKPTTPPLAKSSSSPRRNFLASTQSSLNREAETRQQHQKKLTKTKLDKNNASGYTLISKPKTKLVTNYCTRLDSIDNLNDLTPKKKINVTFRSQKKLPTTTTTTTAAADRPRPWRQNMQVTKKPTLIQPDEHTLKKEYNDMKYDEKAYQWKGNEKSLAGFQEPSSHRTSRVCLMSPKQHTPSKYAASMSSNMSFDAEKQCWVSVAGTECNELDAIEDLEIAPKKPKREYHLSKEIKRQMVMEQQDHEAYMRAWPLKTFEPQLTTDSGHKVGASKYFLKNTQLF